MKTTIQFFEILALATTVLGGPSPAGPAAAAQPEAVVDKADERRLSHGQNGEAVVTLDLETQQRIGLKVTTLVATNLSPEVRGYGRVLDPAPLIALVAEIAPAEVTADASRKERDRLRKLRAQNTASERALETAEAQALRDHLLTDSLRAKLMLGWGKAIAESDQLLALAKSLAGTQAALVRVDLPAGERLPGKPTTARLVPLTAGVKPLAAEFISAATSTDPQFQGQGFLFLIRTNALTPNTALTGMIQTDGPPVSGRVVPANAVIRHEDKGWTYVQTGDRQFTRREVPLGRATAEGYLVTSGFAAGARVVTTGAQLLLSEELKGQGGEE